MRARTCSQGFMKRRAKGSTIRRFSTDFSTGVENSGDRPNDHTRSSVRGLAPSRRSGNVAQSGHIELTLRVCGVPNEGKTNVPAEYASPQADARLSRQNELEEWPFGAQTAPCKGSKAPDRQ